MRFRKRDLALLAFLLAALFAALRGGFEPRTPPPAPHEPSAVEPPGLIRQGPYRVTKVLDGDTIKLSNGETVRLIGVDAPEIHHPELPVQRFGQEASDFLQRMVGNFEVTLELEPGESRDKYKRLLAYVWKGDRLANAEIIRRGYAYAYTRFPFRRQDEFLALEREARRAQYGLWHLSLRDGRIANLAARYDQLSLEGRRKLDEALEQLVREYPAEPAPAAGLPPSEPPPDALSWQDAAKRVGQRVRVEGRIVATRNTGKVCFLNFHADYKHCLTAIIFSSAFPRFPSSPEKHYRGKRVRVTGMVTEKDARTEIVLEDPAQIQVLD